MKKTVGLLICSLILSGCSFSRISKTGYPLIQINSHAGSKYLLVSCIKQNAYSFGYSGPIEVTENRIDSFLFFKRPDETDRKAWVLNRFVASMRGTFGYSENVRKGLDVVPQGLYKTFEIQVYTPKEKHKLIAEIGLVEFDEDGKVTGSMSANSGKKIKRQLQKDLKDIKRCVEK